MIKFSCGAAMGFMVGLVLVLDATSKTQDRDIDRGWSYLSGEKYFLTRDDDAPQ